MKGWIERMLSLAPAYARIALAVAFLSAVADRVGLWGPPGPAGVAWGDFAAFLEYTGTLNPWFPDAVIPLVAWLVTVAEVLLALALLIGWRLREVGLASGLLLAAFGVGMLAGSGLKAPLDASVFSASAAAFLLALVAEPR